MKIDGTTAIVSGGGSGLGAATARHLAGLGARVGVLDFDAERAAAVADGIGGMAVQADVRNADAVEDAVARVVDALGAPRIAVSCAGIADAGRVVGREGKVSVDLFRRVVEVNLIGTYNVMTYAARAMMENEPDADGQRGVVVNTASIAYQDGQMGQTAYAASKGGVASMCLPAAREMARQGVRVCAIAPGLFRTPMMEGLPEETVAGIAANVPFPARLGDPSEYALLVEQIVRNPYLNGEVIRLDGATRLPPR